MKIEFDSSFEKQILKIKDSSIKEKIAQTIIQIEDSKGLSEINNLKKLKGYKIYYRIKIGDYRLGFELIDNKIIYLIAFLHRKDIYKKFP